MKENHKKETETLRKIHGLIGKNPGIHLSKIAELLDLKITDIEYFLQYLEKRNIIVVTEEAGYKRYYIEKRRIKTREKRTLETRKEIYDLITQNPGLHLSKIAEKLDMSIPLTDYHLASMRRNKEIIVVKEPGEYYKKYYIAEGGVENRDKKVLEVLRKKTPLRVVVFLLKHNTLKHKEILDLLDITSSTLSYHLTNLVDSGIVDVSPHGREKGYSLKNRDDLVRIMKKYELAIELHLAIEGFKDMWRDLSYLDMLG